jgi:hypothetical protein
MSAFNHGMDSFNQVKFTGVMVPVNDLSKLSDARVAFIMEGARSSIDSIIAAANAAHVVTMSSDISCAQNNKCVLGILNGGGSIDIYYSQAAADAAKIQYAPAFLMLVKHV